MLDDTSNAYLNATLNDDHDEADRLARVLDTAVLLEQAADKRISLGDAARDYARRGISVFPLQPRGKTPLTSHGFKDATVDIDRITAWWTATPDANIGVPTGHTFDVVDIDGIDGMCAIYNGTDPVIDSLTVLGIARTSRDGGRHIYVPPAGIGNGANWWPGVDYRGLGGYVVAAPSVGANGRRYQWAQPFTPAQAAAA